MNQEHVPSAHRGPVPAPGLENEDHLTTVRLDRLIDLKEIEPLMSGCARACGVGNALIAPDGDVLLVNGSQPLCERFHHLHPDAARDCLRCNETLMAEAVASGASYLRDCPNGLTDAIAPVMVEDAAVATAIVGQFLTQPPDMEGFRRRARRLGLPEADYLEALSQVPVLSAEQAQTHLKFITGMAGLLARMAHRTLLRREIEERLRDSEARYRSLFEDSPVALWEEDHSTVKRYVDGLVAAGVTDVADYLLQHPDAYAHCVREARVLSVNRATVDLYEAADARDLIERADDLDISDSTRNIRLFWAAMAEGRHSASYEENVRTLKGRAITVHETCLAAPGHETSFDRVYVADRDVTEQKLAETELRRTQQAVETASDDFYAVSPEGRFIYVNRAAARSLGRDQAELIGMAPWEISPGITREGWLVHWERLRREGVVRIETMHRTADGREFPVEITANHVVLDDGEYEFTHVRDILARKEAEKALAESEARYRRLVETAAEGIIILDAERRFLFVNEQFCELLGRRSQELIGRPAETVAFPEDVQTTVSRWRERSEGAPGRYEIALRHADGGKRWVLVSSQPVWDEQGRFAGTFTMLTDIGDRKRAEERVRRTVERLRSSTEAAVKTLARTIEIRDPYTAGHQERVTELALAIGTEIGLPPRALTSLRIAALIHDLGKIAVPAEILAKPGALSTVEWQLIRQHPTTGYGMLKDMKFPGPVATIIYQHHERLDGSGYPRGLTEDKLRIESRIIAVADVMEAMASHRPYRAALGIDAALAEVAEHRGTLFDATVVNACLSLFRERRFHFSESP